MAQGCEDWKLYIRISERYDFALVAEHLTGYRRHPTSMSSDVMQMYRSWKLVAAEMRARWPDCAAEIEAGGDDILLGLIERAQEGRRMRDLLRLSGTLFVRNPRLAAQAIATSTYPWVMRYVRKRLWRDKKAEPSMLKRSVFNATMDSTWR